MLRVTEWLAQRTRIRFAQIRQEIAPMDYPNAIAHLALISAQLQARCDLLEQAVDGIALAQQGSEMLPVGAVRH